MADGNLLKGILGGDDPDKHDGPAAQPASTGAQGADAFAASVIMDAAKDDDALRRSAAKYLETQAALVDRQAQLAGLQLSHFAEDRRAADVAEKRKHVGDWLRNVYQLFIGLVVAGVVLGLMALVYAASGSRVVVVNAFKTPAALANRGYTGFVVASGVLDTLQKLEDATRSVNKGMNITSEWASDVKIEVPQTGVSVGELDRFLHTRLGHDLHIDGDLVQTTTGGLILTVRGDGVPGRPFPGKAIDVDKLITQAAEYVYGCQQPRQYAKYLVGNQREKDGLQFLPGAFARAANDDERADLANVWGNAYLNSNMPGDAVEKFRLARSLNPPNWKAWGNLINALSIMDNSEEAAWQESQRMLRDAQNTPPELGPQLRNLSGPAIETWDMPLAAAANLADLKYNSGAGANASDDGPFIADNYAVMHDPTQAARYLASSDPNKPLTKAQSLLVQTYPLLEGNDGRAAIAPMETFRKMWKGDPYVRSVFNDAPCLLGLAYGLAGRKAEAEAIFKNAGHWARCYAMHGDVLAHEGNLAGAERVWAAGLRLAPDLPPIYLHRGISELHRGDLKRAAADLATANTKAPHYADPLKAWGDVLARQNQWPAALAKYDEALKYAPAWTALHEARDKAAAHRS